MTRSDESHHKKYRKVLQDMQHDVVERAEDVLGPELRPVDKKCRTGVTV